MTPATPASVLLTAYAETSTQLTLMPAMREAIELPPTA